MDRGTHSRSMVGWIVFDCRVANVARALGGHLGGCRVAGLGRVVVARSISLAERSRTSGSHLAALGACVRDSRVSTALAPPLDRDDSPPLRCAPAASAATLSKGDREF